MDLKSIEMSNFTYYYYKEHPPIPYDGIINWCETKIIFNKNLFLNDYILYYSDGAIKCFS
jgi:hypothetical protein